MANPRFSPLAIQRRQTTEALKALVANDGKSEYRLHCQIIDLLKLSGVRGLVFYHVPNGGRRNPREAARLKLMGVLAGVSDLALSIPGVGMAFMEIKAGRGRVSIEQEAFLAAMEAHGHRVAVVRSFDGAVEVLASWGAIAKVRVAA